MSRIISQEFNDLLEWFSHEFKTQQNPTCHHHPSWFSKIIEPQNQLELSPVWEKPETCLTIEVWTGINHHKLYLEACVYSQRTINNRPGGYSDLKPNVYFILAGPCGLQLHVCKEFDQIPFSKCLKPAFWVILFWYMHALLTNVFFSEHFHPKASLCNCRPVAWNKCFFWTHCHCHCCAYCISNGLAFGLCKTIFTRSTQTT